MHALLCASALLLLCGQSKAGSWSVERLELFLANLFEFYNEQTELPLPSLSSEQIERLADGKAVHLIERDPRPGSPGETVDRVVGMRVIPLPREQVWIAALDPDVPISDLFHDVRLDEDGKGYSRWWVYLDLPWPLADRHWVADLWKNRDLSASAGGYVWEHRWDLAADGEAMAEDYVKAGGVPDIQASDLEAAIYLPVNRGGLVAAQLDEGHTLLIYNLSTVVGGFIPDRVVRAFSRQEVGRFLRDVELRAAEVLAHYTDDHERVFDGDGMPIPSRTGGSAHDHEAAHDP